MAAVARLWSGGSLSQDGWGGGGAVLERRKSLLGDSFDSCHKMFIHQTTSWNSRIFGGE